MGRNRGVATAASLALLGGALSAAPPTAGTPPDDYGQLLREFRDAQRAWFDLLGEKPTPADELPPHPAAEFAPRFRALAERHAGKSAAVRPLGWLVSSANTLRSSSANKPPADSVWALERLTADHAADPLMAEILPELRYAAWGVGRARLLRLYDAVLAKNPDTEARAQALYSKAAVLYEVPEDGSDDAKRAADRQQAHTLFQKVVKDYADSNVVESAQGFLFELEHLQVGMKAPDFTGQDVDGKEIRLSQFRGQVVVLDFWGFW